MRRLTILLAATVTALMLVGGLALAQPRDKAAETSALRGGEVENELAKVAAKRGTEAQGPPETRVDYDQKGNPYVAGELMVTYEERASAEDARAANAKVGVGVKTDLHEIDAAAVSVPEIKEKKDRQTREKALRDKKKALEEDPSVESVDYNYLRHSLYTPDDQYYNELWGLHRIKAPEAWNTLLQPHSCCPEGISKSQGDNTSVAVLDSGICDCFHPDLYYQIWAEWDYVENDSTAQDDLGHGTHVAGTVAAEAYQKYDGHPDRPITGVVGVAPGAQLVDARVLDSNGEGSDDDVVAAILDTTNSYKADVINMSLGDPASSQALLNAVNYAWSKDVVVVAAAGNDYENGNPVMYPAAYDNVIAVGATNSANTRARFSEVHPYVDVAAPGVDILSDYPDFGQLGPTGHSICNYPDPLLYTLCYERQDGTSMAAPHVSGVAAILGSRGLPNNEIRRRIEATAVDLGSAGKDNAFGHGLVNAQASLNAPTDQKIVYVSPRGNGVTNEIYVADADGTSNTRLTSSSPPTQNLRPVFSPDSKRLAFQTQRDGNWEIYIMNADGTGGHPPNQQPRERQQS